MIALSILCVLAAAVGIEAACPTPATVPSGSRWVSDPGCSRGTVYQIKSPTKEKCHCWGHCGYICDPVKGSSGGSGGGGSKHTTTKKTSPCPFGGVWYNNKGQRCRCQSFNKKPYYLCEATTTTGSTGSTTAAGGSTAAGSGSSDSGSSSSAGSSSSGADSPTTASGDSPTTASGDSPTTAASG